MIVFGGGSKANCIAEIMGLQIFATSPVRLGPRSGEAAGIADDEASRCALRCHRSRAVSTAGSRPGRDEIRGLFFIRLETASVVCFVGVTAISNRFGLSIRNGRMAPWVGLLIAPYMYRLVIVPWQSSRRFASAQVRAL